MNNMPKYLILRGGERTRWGATTPQRALGMTGVLAQSEADRLRLSIHTIEGGHAVGDVHYTVGRSA